MTAVLLTDSFIETESCDGPRYTEKQPSRETDGVIMTKYIPNFELPIRNLESWLGTIDDSMDRIDPVQKKVILEKFCSEKKQRSLTDSTTKDKLDEMWADPSNQKDMKEWFGNYDNNNPKMIGMLIFVILICLIIGYMVAKI